MNSLLNTKSNVKITQAVPDNIPIPQINCSEQLRIVHRLDKLCSGVMIIAKTKNVAAILSEYLSTTSQQNQQYNTMDYKESISDKISKTYWAITPSLSYSHIKPIMIKTLEYFNQQYTNTTKDLAQNCIQQILKKWKSPALLPNIQPITGGQILTNDNDTEKISITRFLEMKRTQTKSLVALQPVTGRKHQLRIHCADSNGLNSSIFGDIRHNNNAKDIKSSSLYLHCRSITFYHPMLSTNITAYAAPPKYFIDELQNEFQLSSNISLSNDIVYKHIKQVNKV